MVWLVQKAKKEVMRFRNLSNVRLHTLVINKINLCDTILSLKTQN